MSAIIFAQFAHSVARRPFVRHCKSISRHFASGMLKCRKANRFECLIGVAKYERVAEMCMYVCGK